MVRGRGAEDAAATFLTQSGYQILDRNFRTRQGELDVVARRDGVLCFVEVRQRSRSDHGTPEESITRQKRRRLAAAAEQYLVARGFSAEPCRFDVVAIDGEGQMRLLEDAFRLEDC